MGVTFQQRRNSLKNNKNNKEVYCVFVQKLKDMEKGDKNKRTKNN